MNWLMVDYFSPTFPIILTEWVRREKINFLRIVFTRNLTSQVCLLGLKVCVNIICTFKIAGNCDLDIASNIKCKIKTFYIAKVTLLTTPHYDSLVTSLK